MLGVLRCRAAALVLCCQDVCECSCRVQAHSRRVQFCAVGLCIFPMTPPGGVGDALFTHGCAVVCMLGSDSLLRMTAVMPYTCTLPKWLCQKQLWSGSQL
jgi:hypothetical protein